MLLTDLKGISSTRLEQLNKLDIYCVEDLLKFFPKTYLDLTHQSSLFDAYHNDFILTACNVISMPQKVYKGGKKGYVKVLCEQDGNEFSTMWFNQLYVADKLSMGEYLFYGRVRKQMGTQIINPTFEKLDGAKKLSGFIPVYSTKGILDQYVIRNAVNEALEKEQITSIIPLPLCQQYNLMSLKQAYVGIHNPKNYAEKEASASRIALEEYFALVSAFKIIKGGLQLPRENEYIASNEDLKEFIKRFDFEFTNGQKQAVNEIYKSMKSNVKMNRLVQGDVGSGKTAVAFCAIYLAVKSGYQVAMLSPTEVLAKQTFSLLTKYFNDYDVVYLSGSNTAKEKREIKEQIENGKAHIVCGTHAIIQEDVKYNNLSLCVCDEQHRFGVSQRSALLNKGKSCDMLVMSATPIPRTLSLILYGDLDITTISDKPLDRQEISTHIIPERKYNDMLNYISEEVKKGRQAYFICAKINEDESDITSVKELYDELSKQLPTIKFGLMHGKLKEKDKNQVMQDFKDKKFDCLISTTVIEVGVDIPNATIMVINNAERFGLSQLHQLRGRVGRGKEKSFCFLLVGKQTEDAMERLKIFKNCTNGFEIAEWDLKMRGGGDFIGTRQSGKLLKEICGLKYPSNVIIKSKQLSDEVFESGVDLEELKRQAMYKYKNLCEVVLN